MPNYANFLKDEQFHLILILSIGLVCMGVVIKNNGIDPINDFIMDVDYYTKAFEENTEPGSIIATEVNFILCATEGRKIRNVGILINDQWRYNYSSKNLLDCLNPDYIILTQDKMEWGMTNEYTSVSFKNMLKDNFIPIKEVSSPGHVTLWILKRRK